MQVERFVSRRPEVRDRWIPSTALSAGEVRKVSEIRLRLTNSGGRVSNAWATCPVQRDNTVKMVLIPHDTITRHREVVKGEIRYRMGPRPIS